MNRIKNLNKIARSKRGRENWSIYTKEDTHLEVLGEQHLGGAVAGGQQVRLRLGGYPEEPERQPALRRELRLALTLHLGKDTRRLRETSRCTHTHCNDGGFTPRLVNTLEVDL